MIKLKSTLTAKNIKLKIKKSRNLNSLHFIISPIMQQVFSYFLIFYYYILFRNFINIVYYYWKYFFIEYLLLKSSSKYSSKIDIARYWNAKSWIEAKFKVLKGSCVERETSRMKGFCGVVC